MAKFLAQIILASTQVLAKAFARAIKQEYEASQEAARRLGNTRTRAERVANSKVGLSLDEAKQILNISQLDKNEIEEKFDRLFNANDKSRGGSFYIQSKIVRAKERLDLELETLGKSQGQEEASKDSSSKT